MHFFNAGTSSGDGFFGLLTSVFPLRILCEFFKQQFCVPGLRDPQTEWAFPIVNWNSFLFNVIVTGNAWCLSLNQMTRRHFVYVETEDRQLTTHERLRKGIRRGAGKTKS